MSGKLVEDEEEETPTSNIPTERQAEYLMQLRNIVTSSPTFSVLDKEKLAWQYFDNGYISESQLRTFLHENGLDKG